MNKNYSQCTMVAGVNCGNSAVANPLPPKLLTIFILCLSAAMLLSATGRAAVAPQPMTDSSPQSLRGCGEEVGGVISFLAKKRYLLVPLVSEPNRSAAQFIPQEKPSKRPEFLLVILREGGEFPAPASLHVVVHGRCLVPTEHGGGEAVWAFVW